VKQRADGFARSLEVNSWHRAELHITASGFWGTFQWIFGGAAAVLAAVASGTAFSNYPLAAGILALGGAGSAALVTALRPGDLSSQHLKSATDFNTLQNEARNLWEFGLEQLTTDETVTAVGRLSQQWTAITSASPRVPRRLYRVAEARYGRKGMYYFPKPLDLETSHDADPPELTKAARS
jgi:hypothetical protein